MLNLPSIAARMNKPISNFFSPTPHTWLVPCTYPLEKLSNRGVNLRLIFERSRECWSQAASCSTQLQLWKTCSPFLQSFLSHHCLGTGNNCISSILWVASSSAVTENYLPEESTNVPFAGFYTVGSEELLLQLPSMLHNDRKGLTSLSDQIYLSLARVHLQYIIGASFPKCCAQLNRCWLCLWDAVF